MPPFLCICNPQACHIFYTYTLHKHAYFATSMQSCSIPTFSTNMQSISMQLFLRICNPQACHLFYTYAIHKHANFATHMQSSSKPSFLHICNLETCHLNYTYAHYAVLGHACDLSFTNACHLSFSNCNLTACRLFNTCVLFGNKLPLLRLGNPTACNVATVPDTPSIHQ
jgi:uncharacterized protein YjbI with pentapeptide repeats